MASAAMLANMTAPEIQIPKFPLPEMMLRAPAAVPPMVTSEGHSRRHPVTDVDPARRVGDAHGARQVGADLVALDGLVRRVHALDLQAALDVPGDDIPVVPGKPLLN